MNISENTSEINIIGLHEEESNPWTPPVIGRLISLLRIPNKEQKTLVGIPLEDLLDKPLRNIYEEISNLRFGSNLGDNPFDQPNRGQVPVLPTFST